MRTINFLPPAFGAAFLCSVVPAAAQTALDMRDIVTQSEMLNRSADQAAGNRMRSEAEAAGAIDGEAGVYVLLVNDIFHLSAAGALGYTDNPARTSDDVEGSDFGDLSLTAGMATRLGELVDFGVSADVSGREFFDADELSSRTASLSASLGMPIGAGFYASAAGFGGYSYDGEFNNGVRFHGVSINLSAAIPVTPTLLIQPGIGTTRQWAEISENDSTLIAASLDIIQAFTPRVSGSIRVSAVRRWYDDFYEDVTFVEREDTSFGIAAAIAYRVGANASIVASVTYERQRSELFLAEFEAMEGTAGVSARMSF